jgi:transcription termination/antitermination protein NusA
VLSRTDPALLIKLFEQEVPEIYDGTVVIRGAVREAGDRAKVAVYSRERDVDPVGACVGMKGTRVQSIIRELRGEKIDIVEWSEDSILFVTNAISPAKVQRVSIVDDAEKVMEVVVEDKQLSLAIGKKGQNVRLAAKLTGWKIDIKSEEEKRREVEAQFGALEIGGEAAEGATAEGATAEAADGAAVDAATAEPAAAETAAETEPTAVEAAAETEPAKAE